MVCRKVNPTSMDDDGGTPILGHLHMFIINNVLTSSDTVDMWDKNPCCKWNVDDLLIGNPNKYIWLFPEMGVPLNHLF